MQDNNKILSVGERVRIMESNDDGSTTTISKYVEFDLRETINTIDAYINSKHISGSKDSKGRDKPFFNIVTAARNIWYRATDIDRKNIKLKATRADMLVIAFMASLLVRKWMRKAKFGKFLNSWGRTLSTYGSAVIKSVEQGGELICEVVPWNRILCDPINFDNDIKVEKIYLTPSQLRKRKEYDQDSITNLLNALQSRETMEGHKQDTKSQYIEIYEAHGEMELSLLTDKETDDEVYEQQMHVISFVLNKKTGEYDDFTLYRGREKDPYMITHLIEEDGRAIGVGAVEGLFENQWMLNHNKKQIKDILDLASKTIFQTADTRFIGQNVLSAIEMGDIMIHDINLPLTKINNDAPNIGALQAFGQEWGLNANERNNISESIQGNIKSGTAWRQTEAVLEESHSLFETMIENKGFYLEELMTRFVLPHIKKKMDTSEEISELLTSHEIEFIDSRYIPNKARKMVREHLKEKILNGEPPMMGEQEDLLMKAENSIKEGLNGLGGQRFMKPSEIKTKTWKEVLKDFELEIEVDVTGEGRDSRAILATLSTVLQTIAGLNGQPMSPDMKIVFNRILEETGAISPIELNKSVETPTALPNQQPVNLSGVKELAPIR